MEAALYAKILGDKAIVDLKKLRYKYPGLNITELIALLETSVFKNLPLPDFNGKELVYMDMLTQIRMASIKLFLMPQCGRERYGSKAMEDEIASTLLIEDIDFARDSVRRIMKGFAPSDESENWIYGLKKGLDFISDVENKINEQNIHALYQMTIGDFLEPDNKLLSGSYYRHDSVYVMGMELEHTGLDHAKLPDYMGKLIDFINGGSDMNDLMKAAAIHFYIAYLHPYFDGNGRMARLIHLWYLVQQGYSAALYIPLSMYIEKSRRAYYNAYTLAEANMKISGILDVTPFLIYFTDHVYNKLGQDMPKGKTVEAFQKVLAAGMITEKEKDLWNYVLAAYGDREFSTKQLEKDFGNAAYATIRGFALKFEDMGLLSGQKYGNKTKYKINW